MSYLIGIFIKRKGQTVCVDIMKQLVFDDLKECQTACDEMAIRDKSDYKNAMSCYAEKLQEFLMDETMEDSEPLEPSFTHYSYVPQLFTQEQINELP